MATKTDSLTVIREDLREQQPAIDGDGMVSKSGEDIYRQDRGHIKAVFYLSFVALLLGGLYGPLQALDKMGVDLYPLLPGVFRSYYLGLTLHGVGLALLFTFSFIIGFLSFAIIHGLQRPLASRKLGWAAFWSITGGTILALLPLLTNQATVLWTFYAPLQAHPAFYAGLALAVVSTWVAGLNGYLTWRQWKAENPGRRTPLMAFAALATWTMWGLASVGVATAVLFYLLPWSLGLTEGINMMLTRALFWFSGHPVVYFWLLPAYLSWYTMLPAQVGGRLFSESLSRAVFLLFIPLSIPTGLHHMFLDPGVTRTAKLLHSVMTFAVVFPSLLTAFTVVASIEDGARRSYGGRGLLRWVTALPWFSDPSVSGQLLAMLLFAGGGITGIINASYTMNLMVHNTMWVVGHLHFQVGAATTLTFMAVSYWLIPHLTGRALWSRRLAVLQVWTWFVGMAVLGRGMHWMGLAGAPRRTYFSRATYMDFTTWDWAGLLTAAGGILLTISGVIYLYLMVMTICRSRQPANVVVPEAQPLLPVRNMPLVLDRLTPWVLVTVVLVAMAWLPTLIDIARHHPAVMGWKLW